MNIVINKLIKILSLDESLITEKYVESKLLLCKSELRSEPFKASIKWLDAYKLVINEIISRK